MSMKTKYKLYTMFANITLTTSFGSAFVYYSLKHPPINILLAVVSIILCFGAIVIANRFIGKMAQKDLPEQ